MFKSMPTVGDLFAGIGGFSLGLEWAGFEIKWQVEADKYCRKVLKKHWPNVKQYGDIKDVGKHNLEPVDLICGGFPCQPASYCGKQRGREDDRWLWPEMFRIIKEFKPAWVVAENVYGLITLEQGLAFKSLLFDLESEDYKTQSFIIPACAVNAPHRRNRVWIIAHTKGERLQRSIKTYDKQRTQSYDKQSVRCPELWHENWYEAATRLCGVDDGVPNRMDRIRALGNAVVPQVVETIGRAILQGQYRKK